MEAEEGDHGNMCKGLQGAEMFESVFLYKNHTFDIMLSLGLKMSELSSGSLQHVICRLLRLEKGKEQSHDSLQNVF